MEVDSELAEFFQNDATNSQFLSHASAASDKTITLNHVVVKSPAVVRNS